MFPDRKQIIEYYQKVLEVNDKQGVCCNPLFPENIVPEELALHSLSTLQPLSQYRIKPNDRILDIGCGAGADCFLAAYSGGSNTRIYGIDTVEDLITRAKFLKEKYNIPNVEFKSVTPPPLPYEGNCFDLVLMNYSFHIIQDKAQILSEIDRVLVPGGRAIIADNFTPNEQIHSTEIENWFMFAGGAISVDDFKLLTNSTNLTVLDFIQVPESEIIGYMICQKKL